MRWSWWLLTSLVFATASCGTAGYAATNARLAAPADGITASPQPQPDVRFAATEGVAVAGGLSGKFFSDNQDGDVRARTEQLFSYATAGDPGGDAPRRRDRMRVYSGELRVEVPRAEDAGREFLAKIESWGGYLQSQTGTALTVRVPAAHFDEAFEVARSAGRVLAENRRAADVTEEYVDLGIRADNARKSRTRLLAILEKAEKVEDILKIESELRRLTEELERMEGRLKFLADQVAMSTLTAEFRSLEQAPPPVRKRRWSRFGWINRVGANTLMEAF